MPENVGFSPSQMHSHATGMTPAPSTPTPAAATPGAIAAEHMVPSTQNRPQTLADRAELQRGPMAALDTDPEPVLPSDTPEGEPTLLDPDAPAAEPEPQAPVQADPLAEDIHGMSAKELLEHIKEHGTIPEALLDALEWEMKDGDDVQRIKLRDALDTSSQERLQLRDYSRRVSQLDLQQQEFQARVQGFQEAVGALDNPETLIEDLRALKVSDKTIYAAMEKYAQQQVWLKSQPAEVQAMFERQRAMQDQLAQARLELREIKAREHNVQGQNASMQVKAVLQQHFEPALKKYGLNKESPRTLEFFKGHVQALAGGKPWTRETIYKAAQATKQEIDALQRQERDAQLAAKRRGSPLGPRSAAAPLAIQQRQGAGIGINGRKGFAPSEMGRLARDGKLA